MSERYVPIGWSRTKLVYDAVLVVAVAAFLVAFNIGAQRAGAQTTLTDQGSLPIRAFGLCAFLLVTIALAIGPLARLDKRFLPLLYNRRHLGVVTFAVASAHVFTVFDWYFAFSPLDPWVAMLASDAAFGRAGNFPYIPFGLAAFLILGLLAATSHDFWLKFLGPGAWKLTHASIYAAYALIVAHVALGALQDAQNRAAPVVVIGGAGLLICLHVGAAMRERGAAMARLRTRDGDGWLCVGRTQDIPEGRAIVVQASGGEPVAIFNDKGCFAAISHRCAHQNGPLGEGRLVDGRVICPWHGYEFRLSDGCAPAPFTERVPVYPVRVAGGLVYVDPEPAGERRPAMTEAHGR